MTTQASEACCASSHVPADTACRGFERGANGRCVFCDHEGHCHPGPGATCEIGSGENGSPAQDTTMSPALTLGIAVDVERSRRRADVPVPEKWCVDCRRMRPREMFGGRRKTCVDCAPTARDRSGERGATARYREKNQVVLKEKQLAKAREHFAWMDMLKVGPCTDCGVVYPPYVMDWDHVRGDKAFNLGALRAKYSYRNVREWVLAEIAKCDLVCSNCHRERTHQRAQEARVS